MIEFPGQYKKANFRIGGNYKGGGVMKGIDIGELKPGESREFVLYIYMKKNKTNESKT